MISRLQSMPVLFATAGLMLVAVVFSSHSVLLTVMVLVTGAIGAAVVVAYPFAGLALLVFFAQVDAIAHIIFQGLPVSGFKLLTMLVLLGVVLASYKERRWQRLGNDELVLRFVVLFGFSLILSFLFTEEVGRSLWSLRRYFSLFILLYLIIRLTKTPRQIYVLLLVMVLSTLISSLVLLGDWATGGHLVATEEAAIESSWQGESRSSGASDYNPTTSAIMLLTGTAFAAMMLLRLRNYRVWFAGVVLISAAALVLSFSRGVSVVFVIMLFWFMLKIRHHRHFPAAIMAVIMFGLMALTLAPESYIERMATLVNPGSDLSIARRFTYNIIGLDLLVENPIFGIGPGNFPFYYLDFEYRWLPGRVLLPRQLHNTYLQVAVETGLLGFTCFAGILLVAVRGLLKVMRETKNSEHRFLAEAIMFAFVSFLISSLFMPNELTKYLWVLVGLSVAIARVHQNAGKVDGKESDDTLLLRYKILRME